jgi:phage terminase large subunit-like protein
LGVTITEQYLSEVVAQAKAIPGQLNGILRLHFCIWTDAETAWMARSTLEPLLAEFDPKGGQPVWLGLDLSQNRDLTALAGVQRNGEKDGKPCFDAWVEVWTPGDTLSARVLRDKQPYDLWVAGGFLNAPQGENISLRQVAQALAELDSDYRVETVAYDRYAFRRFEEEVSELGLSVNFIEHPQGGTKRGKPQDGMSEGLWMPGSLRHLEELILEGRIRLKRNPVLISAMMSAVTETDRWDNKWLSKQRAINKIDAAVALCMAVGAAMAGDTSGSIDDWLKSLHA